MLPTRFEGAGHSGILFLPVLVAACPAPAEQMYYLSTVGPMAAFSGFPFTASGWYSPCITYTLHRNSGFMDHLR